MRNEDRAGTEYFDYFKINQSGGNNSDNIITISPTDITHIKSNKRKWKINKNTIGHIERLAKSKFEISSLTDDDIEKWLEKEDYHESIAMSVYASSEVEGEGIYVKDMKVAVTDVPETENVDEYELRKAGINAMYRTYFYALSRDFPLEGGKAVSRPFILNLHEKMFKETKPTIAGNLKAKCNQIKRDGKIVVVALPPELSSPYLDAICDALNEKFKAADESGSYSKLIAIAEFLVDFLAIHPFSDGNGRIARLLSTYLLEKSQFHFARFYSLDSIILEKKTEYYNSLYNSQKNWGTVDEDLSDWLNFYIEVVYMQYMNVLTMLHSRADAE
jgi:Fic family protein